jgi:hypothetical protein
MDMLGSLNCEKTTMAIFLGCYPSEIAPPLLVHLYVYKWLCFVFVFGRVFLRFFLLVPLVRSVKLYDLCWLQLTGELKYEPISVEQKKCFYNRSGDLLRSLVLCMSGTLGFACIRGVTADK